MRIGIIGSGGIANAHVQGYRAAGADVVALCDVSEKVLEEKQLLWGVEHGFTSYEALLNDKAASIDAVSICTPNRSHHPIAIAAAKAGKHVHCEKPVSLDLAEANDMIRECANAGVTLQVGHHMRSWSSAVKAKELIDAGAIGKVSYVRLRQAHDWGGGAVRGAFGSKEASGGGTLLDNGCHLFDLARYFCGDVHDVFARMSTRKFEIEVEDTATSSLGFVSGAIGQVEVAWTGTGWQESFWVFGTGGSLECDNRVDGSSVLIHRHRSGLGQTWDGTDITTYKFAAQSAHTQHMMNFVAAVQGKRSVVCTGEDGRESVRLVLASYESAEQGRPVVLDTRV